MMPAILTKTAPTGRDTGAPRKTREGTKQEQLIAMLRRKQGATIAQIVEADRHKDISFVGLSRVALCRVPKGRGRNLAR